MYGSLYNTYRYTYTTHLRIRTYVGVNTRHDVTRAWHVSRDSDATFQLYVTQAVTRNTWNYDVYLSSCYSTEVFAASIYSVLHEAPLNKV